MGVDFGSMTSGHFIFIPAVLLVGIVIGWILGSRAAADAYAARARREAARPKESRASHQDPSAAADHEPPRH